VHVLRAARERLRFHEITAHLFGQRLEIRYGGHHPKLRRLRGAAGEAREHEDGHDGPHP
jgi:hypothetical protein